MGNYLHHFRNISEYNYARSENYSEPWISFTDGVGSNYNKPDYSSMYLTFEILGSGNVTWTPHSSEVIECSKNGGEWITMSSNTSVSVVADDTVRFRGTNTSYSYCHIYCSGQFKIVGNIMSLLYGDNFKNTTSLPGTDEQLTGVFGGNTTLLSAEDLILPAMTLTYCCYSDMFAGCTSLTKAPKLPATTLASYCYYTMFRNCTSLTKTPVLPATNATYRECYSRMFEGCTGLTSISEISATSVGYKSYYQMFKDCTSLTSIPALPAMTLEASCYGYMFRGCTSLTSLSSITLPATTLAENCYEAMFCLCSNLTSAPILPATTLVSSCYGYMFEECTNLSYVKAMFTTTPSSSYTYRWLSGVAATGTFVKNSAATWTTTGISAVPSGWTVQTTSS